MKDETSELADTLQITFGSQVETSFVDISTPAIDDYEEIKKILGRVRLPLTVINGQPVFHGGLGVDMIVDAIQGLSKEK